MVSWMVGKGGKKNVGLCCPALGYCHWGMAMSLVLQGHGDVASREHAAIPAVVTSSALSL